MEPIRNLLHEDILMCSPDPILTCFYSCIVLINIERFRADFADVIKKVNNDVIAVTKSLSISRTDIILIVVTVTEITFLASCYGMRPFPPKAISPEFD